LLETRSMQLCAVNWWTFTDPPSRAILLPSFTVPRRRG
jgi:hypothetical protein